MSHVRNLFHKPPTREQIPVAGFTAAVREDPGLSLGPAAIATASALPTFAVEDAHPTADSRLVYYDNPRSPAADRYRHLRIRLKEHRRTGKLKRILITGALAHDGKSTVTLNLATALAERGKHTVLIVEADLHHSSLAASLKLRPWAGLTECLADDSSSPLSAIRRIEPLGFHLLPAGEPRRNPTELLQTPAFGQMMEKVSPCFDWILIDSPPVIPLTDSLSLQHHSDASLLVVRAGQTPREAVEHTIELLGKNHILGIVLNGVETHNHLYYQYNEYNRRTQED